MSAREWTYAGVRYRMPSYGAALRLVDRAAQAPRNPDLIAQADGVELMAEAIRLCWCDSPIPPAPEQLPDAAEWLADQGWSLVDILGAGACCLTEVQRRLFEVSDGAVKNRDFTSPRSTPSTTS